MWGALSFFHPVTATMSSALQDVSLFSAVELVPYSQPWYDHFRQSLGEGVCRHLGIYPIPDDLVLSVVIPVYNERATLRELVGRVRAVPIRKQIVLVDDGSRDGTRELLRDVEACPDEDAYNTLKIVFHEKNRGKGAA